MDKEELESAKRYLQDCRENGDWIPLIIFAFIFGFDKLPEEIRKEVDKNEP